MTNHAHKMAFNLDKTLTAIGLMSGTSLDGIDVALLRTDGQQIIDRGPCSSVPYDSTFQAKLTEALQVATQIKSRNQRPQLLADVEKELTMRHVEAVRDFMSQNNLAACNIDVVGFHGQTVLHRPEEGLTLQLGDGALLSQELGIQVVYDMRARDMECGGQGAPLAPVYHQALAANLDQLRRGQTPVCFVNIGGISNVTYVTPNNDPIAFDCGTGNVLIDQWVTDNSAFTYDEDGALGLEGQVDEEIAKEIVARYQTNFADGRSLDRLDFPPLKADSLSLQDGARTLAAVTGRLIAQSCKRMPETPKLWVLSGGGRLNAAIVAELAAALPKHSQIVLAEDIGISGDSVEAEAWAYLAVRAIKALPLTFPTTTGVSHPITGGILARA